MSIIAFEVKSGKVKLPAKTMKDEFAGITLIGKKVSETQYIYNTKHLKTGHVYTTDDGVRVLLVEKKKDKIYFEVLNTDSEAVSLQKIEGALDNLLKEFKKFNKDFMHYPSYVIIKEAEILKKAVLAEYVAQKLEEEGIPVPMTYEEYKHFIEVIRKYVIEANTIAGDLATITENDFELLKRLIKGDFGGKEKNLLKKLMNVL